MKEPGKPKRLVAATKEKKCTICGSVYGYPTKGSSATRHKCELCVELPEPVAKSMKKLNDRIRHLESRIATFENPKTS